MAVTRGVALILNCIKGSIHRGGEINEIVPMMNGVTTLDGPHGRPPR
jgi:hypothetical protein